MAKIEVEKIEAALRPEVEALGYELVEAGLKTEFGMLTLTLYFFKQGGVSHDDCEAVHKRADVLLDEIDPTDGAPYNLNVSSLGLDRPIVKRDDWRRSIGTEVEVFLTKAFSEAGEIVAESAAPKNEGKASEQSDFEVASEAKANADGKTEADGKPDAKNAANTASSKQNRAAKSLANVKVVVGILIETDEDMIVLVEDKTKINLKLYKENIAKARPFVRF